MRDVKFIDVPVRKPWAKRWFVRSAKLALIVGIAGAGYEAWTRFSRYEENRASMMQSEIGYRCAANLSDDTLTKSANGFGTIDISSLGCTAKPFFVSMQEVSDMRAGNLKFEPYQTPFDWRSTTIAFFAFALMSLLVTSTCILLVATARWVWS